MIHLTINQLLKKLIILDACNTAIALVSECETLEEVWEKVDATQLAWLIWKLDITSKRFLILRKPFEDLSADGAVVDARLLMYLLKSFTDGGVQAEYCSDLVGELNLYANMKSYITDLYTMEDVIKLLDRVPDDGSFETGDY